MKKIILLFLFLFVVDVLPRTIGWYQYPGGRNIGWDQNDGAGGDGGDTIIALTFLSDSVSTTTYSVICSLYTDSGGIARLYDSSGGSWVQVDSTDWQDGGTGFRDTLGRTGLSPETKYYYMVIAEDSCGQYDTIQKDSVTTLPLLPDISVSATICTTDIFMDTVTISNAGGTVDSFIFIDALPIGLYHDTATGKIFGACSLIFSAPQTNYRVAAYNASGADTANFALTVRLNTQIYVDHRHVDDGFPNIPDAYVSLVKTKLFNVSGESHGRGYAYGIMKLDSVDGTGKYASKVFWTGPPTAAADTLRLVMGFHNGATWIPNGGEEDEYTNAAAITVMNNFIDYCATTLVDTLTAHIFGWCWDMTLAHAPNGDTDWVYGCRWAGTSLGGPDGDTIWGLDLADTLLTSNHVCMQSYLDAIEFYDTSNSVARAVYSTGPADNHSANETGYQRRVKHQTIRAFVRADSTRVFYDYSDILSHNNAGEEYVDETGWTDFNDEFQTYPTIQAVNEGAYDGGDGDCHVADTGVIRIGKGLWYLMARLSGWNGDTIDVPAIDSIVAKTQRHSNKAFVRVLDTAKVYGINFKAQGDSSVLFVNSTGTIRGETVGWWDNVDIDSIYARIPSGTPRGYYKMRVRSADEVLSAIPAQHNSRVLVPSTGSVQ